MVQQLSVFLENAPGRLAKLVRSLGDAGINMHLLVVADTVDYGVARLICSEPQRAAEVLREQGLSATITEVVAVEIPDQPGALADLIEFASAKGFNIEYAYCFVEPSTGNAVNVFRLDDPSAPDVLREGGYRVLSTEEVYGS